MREYGWGWGWICWAMGGIKMLNNTGGSFLFGDFFVLSDSEQFREFSSEG